MDISTQPATLIRLDDPVESSGSVAAQCRALRTAAGMVAVVGVAASMYGSVRGDSPITPPSAEAAQPADVTTAPEPATLRLPSVGSARAAVAGPAAPRPAPPSATAPAPTAAPPASAPQRDGPGFEQWIPGPALAIIDDFSGYWSADH